MARDPKTLVSNGGKSRAGEKRKNPKKKSDTGRDPKSRKVEYIKRLVKREVDNIEHQKNGLYECGWCYLVKPESHFPQAVPTSGKFSRYECCAKCLDTSKEVRVLSGVSQTSRERNRTRSISTQKAIKANLKGKPGFEEYKAECDAANPPTMFKIRCTKEEMGEKFPLVHHG